MREGLTTAQIAHRLVVSRATVRSHVAAIVRKLRVPGSRGRGPPVRDGRALAGVARLAVVAADLRPVRLVAESLLLDLRGALEYILRHLELEHLRDLIDLAD